jgi:hypothetical protein
VAWKGALEAGQKPENQVEDPEGEGDETNALLPEKWWQGRGHWKQVRDQKTRWKTPKEKKMRPSLYLPEKWWQGRGHWKQVRDQKTRWKTPKEKGMRPVQVTRLIMTQVMLTPAIQ